MLTEENITLFKKVARKLELKKNEFFVRENELCDLIGIVSKDLLSIYLNSNFTVQVFYNYQLCF